jgi:hypothetical protein
MPPRGSHSLDLGERLYVRVNPTPATLEQEVEKALNRRLVVEPAGAHDTRQMYLPDITGSVDLDCPRGTTAADELA